MLRNFRSVFKSSRTPVAAIMLALAVAMLAYLVPSNQPATAPDSVVARVYGREVLKQDVDEAMFAMAQQMGGNRANLEQMRAFIEPQAQKTAIQEKLVEEMAERHGVVVTDVEVRNMLTDMLKKQPLFLNADGSVKSSAEINDVLRERGSTATVQGEEKSIRKNLLRQKLVQMAAFQVPVDEAWMNQEDRARHEKISFDAITLKTDPASIKDADDASLESYLKQSGALFQQSLRRMVQYVVVERSAFSDLAVDDNALKAAYEQKKSSFGKPAQARVRHILYRATTEAELAAASQKAETLRARLIQGADMAKLASNESDDPSAKGEKGNQGLMDWLDKDSPYVPEFKTTALSLKKIGEISQPVKTQYGIHVLKLEGLKPETITPFEEVKNSLRAQLEEERFAQRATERLEQIRKRANGGDLANAAKAMSSQTRVSLPFLDENGVELEGLTETLGVVKGAFALKVGEVSKPLRAGDRYTLYRVQEERPVGVPPLKEIRKKVQDAWKQEEARKQLLAKAQGALKNGDFKALQTMGGESKTESQVTVASKADLAQNPAMRKALLDMAVGAETPFLWNAAGQLWIAKLTQRTPAPALTFETRRALIQDIQNEEAGRLLASELQTLDRQGRLSPGFSSLWGHLNGIWIAETQKKDKEIAPDPNALQP
jgi:peptidyl-prolyl cis-trans isomerase D